MLPEAPFYVLADHPTASLSSIVLCDTLQVAAEVARDLNQGHKVRVVSHQVDGKPAAGNRMVLRAVPRIHLEPISLNKEN